MYKRVTSFIVRPVAAQYWSPEVAEREMGRDKRKNYFFYRLNL